MQARSTEIPQLRYSSIGLKHCPQCDGDLFRIPRRPIDRIMSGLVPVQRFCCHRFSCQWVGNLRVDPHAFDVTGAGSGSPPGNRVRVPGYVPRRTTSTFFAGNMALCAVGIVLLIVVATTDLFSGSEIANMVQSDAQWLASAKLTNQGTRLERVAGTAPNPAPTSVAGKP